jgi:hypothetical protein
MREFCTLFDGNYLFKAVAMARSLERHVSDHRLTCFCFDDDAKRLVDALALPHVATVSLEALEAHDQELLSTKADRTPTEYCWTSTPALPLYMFETRPELDEVTYLDADLLFFSDPEPLFAEMGDASVLITPHRFSREYAHHAVSGIYNVQFLTFRRDEHGMETLRWWHDRCIEWCYYRLEDGKLGDQKYLDDWPERFAGIHVLQHKGGGLAPWNILQYDIAERDGRVFVDDDPLVFFHYHRVKLVEGGKHQWQPPGYHIDARNRELIYLPYDAALDAAVEEVRAIEPRFARGIEPKPPLRDKLRDAYLATAATAVRRAPWLARIRHPRSGQAGA